jgi:hypothetical protein
MLVCNCTTDHNFMAGDHPAAINAVQGALVGGPKGKAKRAVREKIDCLNIASGLRHVAFDGGKLRPQHVLRGTELLKSVRDIAHPVLDSAIGLGTKANNFDIVGKTGSVAVKIPLVDGCGVVEHHILQFDAVLGIIAGHKNAVR